MGGAPANFAYIASQLGNAGIIASRIGADADGAALLAQADAKGLITDYLQRDDVHPTGRVEVALDAHGQPSYIIHENAAWDFLEFTPDWAALAARADAVCFGTLAQRGAVSATTIERFMHALRPDAVRVFDVNLRQNFFTPEILRKSLMLARITKLNHEELPLVARLLNTGGTTLHEQAARLRAAFDLQLLCVTRGGNGSLLLTADAQAEHAGCPVKIADTVGAGDAFTAALVHHYLRGASLDKINAEANRVGAFVASQPGATPPLKG